MTKTTADEIKTIAHASEVSQCGEQARFAFICYRSLDVSWATALHSALAFRLGKEAAFRDQSNLDAGETWPLELRDRVSHAAVILIVIGKAWLNVLNERRDLQSGSSRDWVRHEIELAIAARKPLIPVLLEDAKLPAPSELPESIRELVNSQSIHLRSDSWDRDVSALAENLVKRHGFIEQCRSQPKEEVAARFRAFKARPDFSELNSITPSCRTSDDDAKIIARIWLFISWTGFAALTMTMPGVRDSPGIETKVFAMLGSFLLAFTFASWLYRKNRGKMWCSYDASPCIASQLRRIPALVIARNSQARNRPRLTIEDESGNRSTILTVLNLDDDVIPGDIGMAYIGECDENGAVVLEFLRRTPEPPAPVLEDHDKKIDEPAQSNDATHWTILLDDIGANAVTFIRAYSKSCDLSLRLAREICVRYPRPVVLAKCRTKTRAEAIAAELQDAGAKVRIVAQSMRV